MRPLSAAQRTAIRDIADGKPVTNSRTYDSLRKRGLVTAEATLTAGGRRTYDRIMESGDGPEDLKEMFRFLSPRAARR